MGNQTCQTCIWKQESKPLCFIILIFRMRTKFIVIKKTNDCESTEARKEFVVISTVEKWSEMIFTMHKNSSDKNFILTACVCFDKTYRHRQAWIHTHTYTHPVSHAHTHPWTEYLFTNTHTFTLTHTHTHTHAHPHTHARTHTHTHRVVKFWHEWHNWHKKEAVSSSTISLKWKFF